MDSAAEATFFFKAESIAMEALLCDGSRVGRFYLEEELCAQPKTRAPLLCNGT
jgi:hypothetical protein